MKKHLIILSIIISIYIISIIYLWYLKFWWLDTIMHIAGGVWICSLFLYIVSKQNFNFLDANPKISKENFLSTALYVLIPIGFVALIGVLWEFYEFFMDVIIFKKYIFYDAPGYILFDTLKDLFNDLLGGILFLTLYKFKSRAVKSNKIN